MKAYALDPEEVSVDRAVGRILCQDIVAVGNTGRVRLSKGRVIQEDDIPVLQTYAGEIHLVEMGPGDVHEDEASVRLAVAVAGEGLEATAPSESQTHLRAAHRGVVDVNVGALESINTLSDVSVYTLYDGQPVDVGRPVAATKVTPLVVPAKVIEQAELIAHEAYPVVSVHAFLRRPVGVIVRDRLPGKARDKFESALNMKLSWFDSPVSGIRYVPDDMESIIQAIDEFRRQGVALLLAAGVNSTDPLDLTIQALERLGARAEHRGVPAHPGSTCWLAYIDEIPVFGLALCGMFSQTTVLDLLLPRFLSGHEVRTGDIAALGHGGMLSKDMAFRFPTYRTRTDS